MSNNRAPVTFTVKSTATDMYFKADESGAMSMSTTSDPKLAWRTNDVHSALDRNQELNEAFGKFFYVMVEGGNRV